MSSERAPSLVEFVRRFVERERLDLHVAMPAVVTAYDASKQMVSVQPLVKQSYLDEEDARQVESFPVIAGVPVVFPGAGAYRLTFPICDGSTVVDGGSMPPATTGLVVFADRSLDKWLTGKGDEVDPELDLDHALSDAIFIPELRPFGKPRSSVPTDHATLGVEGGPQAHFRSDHITIGDESGAQPIALGQALADFIGTPGPFPPASGLLGYLANMTLPVSGGTAGPPTAFALTAPSIKASQGKVK